MAFVLSIGLSHWLIIPGLGAGGVRAAPIGAWACTRAPVKPFMILAGLLVVAMNVRTMLRYLEFV